MTLYPTSLLYRILQFLPYWLLAGAAAATWFHHRRGGWYGLRWVALIWLFGLISWGAVALEIATTRPPGRRVRP